MQAFATNTVSATITEIAKAGALIDAAVSAGANQVYGPSLSRSDQSELYRNALKAAVADARASAQVLAQRPTSRSAASPRSSRAAARHSLARSPPKAMDASSTPVEPGTQQVTAAVTVTFPVS